MAENEMDSGL